MPVGFSYNSGYPRRLDPASYYPPIHFHDPFFNSSLYHRQRAMHEAMWGPHMGFMDDFLYNTWISWQVQINYYANITVIDARDLLRDNLKERRPDMPYEEIEELLQKFLDFTSKAGADETGRVKEITSSVEETTTTTITQRLREECASKVEEDNRRGRRNGMNPREMRAGQADEDVKLCARWYGIANTEYAATRGPREGGQALRSFRDTLRKRAAEWVPANHLNRETTVTGQNDRLVRKLIEEEGWLPPSADLDDYFPLDRPLEKQGLPTPRERPALPTPESSKMSSRNYAVNNDSWQEAESSKHASERQRRQYSEDLDSRYMQTARHQQRVPQQDQLETEKAEREFWNARLELPMDFEMRRLEHQGRRIPPRPLSEPSPPPSLPSPSRQREKKEKKRRKKQEPDVHSNDDEDMVLRTTTTTTATTTTTEYGRGSRRRADPMADVTDQMQDMQLDPPKSKKKKCKSKRFDMAEESSYGQRALPSPHLEMHGDYSSQMPYEMPETQYGEASEAKSKKKKGKSKARYTAEELQYAQYDQPAPLSFPEQTEQYPDYPSYQGTEAGPSEKKSKKKKKKQEYHYA